MNNNLRKSEVNASLNNKNKFIPNKQPQLFRSYVSSQRINPDLQKRLKTYQPKLQSILPVQNNYISYNKKIEGPQYKDKFIKTKNSEDYSVKLKNEFYETDEKRTIELLKRQVQAKDSKNKQLLIKCNHLYSKLKLFLNDAEININLEGLSEDHEKKIKRLENLLRIKNEQVFFKIKVQASNLLEQFQVDKNQIIEINQLENQNAIFDFLINKLKVKLKDFKSKQRENTQELHKDRLLKQKNQETIHFLTETNQILKNAQLRTKQKLEDVKQQWAACCQKLTIRERQLQQKDNELFKIKKLYQQSQNLLLKTNSNERYLNSLGQQTKRQSETVIRQLRTLLTNYNLQKKQLASYLEQKESIIEQMSIRQKFNQEQHDKITRQYTRWRERYEWLQKEKQQRTKTYQEQIQLIENEFEEYKALYNNEIVQKLKEELQNAYKEIQHYKMSSENYEEELKLQNEKRLTLQNNYYQKIQELESEYIKKIQSIQQSKQNQINQIIKMKEQNEAERINQLELNWQYKFQQQDNLYKAKLGQIQNIYMEKITKLVEQCQQYKQIIEQQSKILTENKLIPPSNKITEQQQN